MAENPIFLCTAEQLPCILPHAVRTYQAAQPHVVVAVREATPSTLVRALLAGEIDLIVGRPAPTPENDQLTRIPLYREPVRLVVGAGNPLANAESLSLHDLVDLPWVVPDEQAVLRAELEQVFINLGLSLQKRRVECFSILTIKSLLTKSDYIAALPTLIATEEPGLVPLDIELPGVSRTVGVTRRRQSVLSAQGEEFLRHLDRAAVHMRGNLDNIAEEGHATAESMTGMQ